MIRPMRVSNSTMESAYLVLDMDLCSNSGAGMLGWCTFMKFTLMKNGLSRLGCGVQEFQRGFLNVAVEEGNADHAFLAIDHRCVHVLPVDLEILDSLLTGLAGQ